MSERVKSYHGSHQMIGVYTWHTTGSFTSRLQVLPAFFLLVVPVLGSDITTSISGGGTVVQSRPFTITIIGVPNSQYYVWVTGTFSMTGTTGEQPPVVQASIEGVAQDPAGGPYTIGSYAFRNGNSRTIQQDVAPSTP